MTINEAACKNQGLITQPVERAKAKAPSTAAERREAELFRKAATQRKRSAELHERLRTNDAARKSEAEEREEALQKSSATQTEREQASIDRAKTAGRAGADLAEQQWKSKDSLTPGFLRRDKIVPDGDAEAAELNRAQAKAYKRLQDFLSRSRR